VCVKIKAKDSFITGVMGHKTICKRLDKSLTKLYIYGKEFFMDMYQIVDSESLLGIFELPLALRNRKVEVIIRPLEIATGMVITGESAFGCLHRFANPAKITGEKGAWERVLIENYAKDRC
jgi:hypothetical protein